MPKSAKERLDRMFAGFTISDDGVLALDGLRSVIFPASILPTVHTAGRQILGPGISGILYLAGEMSGKAMARTIGAAVQGDSQKAFRIVAEQARLRGFGRLEATTFDLGTGRGQFRVLNSPFADIPNSYEEGTCSFAAGFWAGVLSVLGRREVAIVESSCRATGADACTFDVAPTPF